MENPTLQEIGLVFVAPCPMGRGDATEKMCLRDRFDTWVIDILHVSNDIYETALGDVDTRMYECSISYAVGFRLRGLCDQQEFRCEASHNEIHPRNLRPSLKTMSTCACADVL